MTSGAFYPHLRRCHSGGCGMNYMEIRIWDFLLDASGFTVSGVRNRCGALCGRYLTGATDSAAADPSRCRRVTMSAAWSPSPTRHPIGP